MLHYIMQKMSKWSFFKLIFLFVLLLSFFVPVNPLEAGIVVDSEVVPKEIEHARTAREIHGFSAGAHFQRKNIPTHDFRLFM